MEATESERAYQLIHDDIVAGELAPGSKLKVVSLRSRYGIGASPLREALARLSGDQLICAESNRGFRVSNVTVEDALDVGRVRLHLELECLRDAVANGGEEWEGRVVAAYHRLSKAEVLPKSNPDRLSRLEERNAAFHDALVSSCTSPLLLNFRAQVFSQHERYRNISRSLPSNGRNTKAEHEAIFEAALKYDAKKLVEASLEHIEGTTQRVVRYLETVQVD